MPPREQLVRKLHAAVKHSRARLASPSDAEEGSQAAAALAPVKGARGGAKKPMKLPRKTGGSRAKATLKRPGMAKRRAS